MFNFCASILEKIGCLLRWPEFIETQQTASRQIMSTKFQSERISKTWPGISMTCANLMALGWGLETSGYLIRFHRHPDVP